MREILLGTDQTFFFYNSGGKHERNDLCYDLEGERPEPWQSLCIIITKDLRKVIQQHSENKMYKKLSYALLGKPYSSFSLPEGGL